MSRCCFCVQEFRYAERRVRVSHGALAIGGTINRGLGAQNMKKSHIQCLAAFGFGISLLVVCMVMLSQPVWAQSTYGTVTGSITDPSGAAIAGAQVTLTNLGTSEKRTQPTESHALYSFPNLFPSRHTITVHVKAFNPC